MEEYGFQIKMTFTDVFWSCITTLLLLVIWVYKGLMSWSQEGITGRICTTMSCNMLQIARHALG